MRWGGLFVAGLPALASAAPATTVYQGRLIDPTGMAVTGSRDLTISIYDGANALKYRDTFQDVPVQDGYFSVVLGSGVSLTDAALNVPEAWVGIAIDGGTELPVRTRLHSAPYARQAGMVSGVVQLSNDATACGSGTAGRLRWTTQVEVCDGTNWIPVARSGSGTSADPAQTCATLKQNYPATVSGAYYIDPDGLGGATPFQVYCEMTVDGGGWTRVASVATGISVCDLTLALGTSADVVTGTATSWLPAATVATIPWAKDVLILERPTNWVVFRSTHATWSWTNIANGTIGNAATNDIGVKYTSQADGGAYYDVGNSDSACNSGNGDDCLLGAFDRNQQWLLILGIGRAGRSGNVQDSTCQSGPTTSGYRGLYGGSFGWNQDGHVYIR
jgi:hypothetical protein